MGIYLSRTPLSSSYKTLETDALFVKENFSADALAHPLDRHKRPMLKQTKKARRAKCKGTTDVYVHTILSCLFIWISTTSLAVAWGPVAHAVIGQLAEDDLRAYDVGLKTLLVSLRDLAQRQKVTMALLGVEPPAPGQALGVFANWPDVQKRQSGMLPHDDRRHYVNLPQEAHYNRRQHCPDGVCSLETLLEQRAILADRRAALPRRAVALAWVAHLVGDMHQPLHAGNGADRGGNLTCVTWMGQPSSLVSNDGHPQCSGANLHAVWDSDMIEAVTHFTHAGEASAFARQLRPFLPSIRAAEPPLTARTGAQWRAVVERWHTETHALILQDKIYPHDGIIDEAYYQRHYPTVRRQLLRAAVRLAALLHQSLQP